MSEHSLAIAGRFMWSMARATYLQVTVREMSVKEFLSEARTGKYEMVLTADTWLRWLTGEIRQWVYAQPETRYLRSSMGSINNELSDYMREVERCANAYPEFTLYKRPNAPPLVVYRHEGRALIVDLAKHPHPTFI